MRLVRILDKYHGTSYEESYISLIGGFKVNLNKHIAFSVRY